MIRLHAQGDLFRVTARKKHKGWLKFTRRLVTTRTGDGRIELTIRHDMVPVYDCYNADGYLIGFKVRAYDAKRLVASWQCGPRWHPDEYTRLPESVRSLAVLEPPR